MPALRIVTALAAVAAVAGVTGSATASTGPDGDRQAVVRLHAAIDAAWNAGDARAFASHWTRDGTVVNPFGALTAGRDRIEEEQAAAFAGPMRGSRHRLTAARISWPRPGVAVVDGTAEISDLAGPDGTVFPPLTTPFTSVCVHKDGAWLVSDMRSYTYLSR